MAQPPRLTADDRALLATETLSKCVGVNGVVALGLPGRGKSTLVSILLGALFEVIDNRLQLQHTPVTLPSAGHQTVDAHTVHINVYKNEEMSNYTFLDLAGLAENRGEVLSRWTRGTLRALCAVVKSFDAILICINGSELPGIDRATTLVSLAKELAGVFKGASKAEMAAIARAFVFVIKDPPTARALKGRLLSLDELRELAETHRDELNASIAAAAACRRQATRDAEQANAEQQAGKQAELFLTEAFIDAINSKRCVYSQPFDANKCKALAAEVFTAIKAASPIDAALLRLLRQHREDQDETLSFSSGLLTPACEELLVTLNEILQDQRTLVSAAERQQGALTGINEGQWETVKQTKRMHLRSDLQALKQTKQELRVSLSRLETDDALVPLHNEPICVQKSSGLFSWTIFGGGWAVKDYQYATKTTFNREVPFARCDITKNHCVVSEWKENRLKGTVSFHVESDRGFNLDEHVTIFTLARQHPNIEGRISTLTSQVEAIEAAERDVEAKLRALEDCHDAKSLAAFLVGEASQLQARIKAKQQKLLHTPYTQLEDSAFHERCSPFMPLSPDSLTPENTRLGLARLVKLFDDFDLHNAKLVPAARDSIREFRARNTEFETLCNHDLLQNLFPTQVDTPSKPCVWEDAVPASKLSDAQLLRKQMYSSMFAFFSRLTSLQCGAAFFVAGGILASLIAVAIATGGMLPKFWVLFALLLVSLGVVLVTHVIDRTVRITVEQVAEEWKQERRQLHAVVSQVTADLTIMSSTATQEMRASLDHAVTRLTDNFRVDVQHSSRIELDKLPDRIDFTGIRASVLGF